MTRAEEAALMAYPVKMLSGPIGLEEPKFDFNSLFRCTFIEGYEQAEKNIISIIESRISEILGDAQPNPVLRAELQELIEKIKR